MTVLRWLAAFGVLMFTGSLTQELSPTDRDLGRVVFVRGDALVIAEGRRPTEHILLRDREDKRDPQWSPRQELIVYQVKGRDSGQTGTHGELVVVDLEGRQVRRVPVTTAIGAFGWHSPDTVFASTSIDAGVGEYRAIRLSDGHETTFRGTSFTPCTPLGRVARLTDLRESPDQKARIAIDDRIVYTGGAPETRFDQFGWTNRCSILVFRVTQGDTRTVVLLGDGNVEATLPWPATDSDEAIISTEPRDIFVRGPRSYHYDPTVYAWRNVGRYHDNWADVRADAVQRLGGSMADWARP